MVDIMSAINKTVSIQIKYSGTVKLDNYLAGSSIFIFFSTRQTTKKTFLKLSRVNIMSLVGYLHKCILESLVICFFFFFSLYLKQSDESVYSIHAPNTTRNKYE